MSLTKKLLVALAVVLLVVQSLILIAGIAFVTMLVTVDTAPDLSQPNPALTVSLGERFHIYNQSELLLDDHGYRRLLLKDIAGYTFEDDKLYAAGEEGYAVADKAPGTCRLYITKPEVFHASHTFGQAGRVVEHENIQYLNSFSDFSDEEQEILKKLEN